MKSRPFYLTVLRAIAGFFGLSIWLFLSGCNEIPQNKNQAVTPQEPAVETPAAAAGNTGVSFRNVASTILPSVVEIRVTDDSQVGGGFSFSAEESTGLGSGVLVAREGTVYYAVTNNHVIDGFSEIVVLTSDETEHPGILVGADSRLDIAVVSFESKEKELPVAILGDSDLLAVGDWVLAAGNPFGLTFSITAGVVSALERIGPSGNISDFIQTDASINRGNSGGPLVDLSSEVIGINTWITTDTGINVGLGFAMPINNIKKAISDIISGGAVRYGWLGVEIGDIEEREAASLSIAGQNGVIIRGVFNNSPAESGGIFPGDVVVAINGENVTDYRHLSRIVGSIGPGQTAEFDVYRAGEKKTLTMAIGLRASEKEIEKAYNEMWPGFSVIHGDEGFTIYNLTPLGIPKTAGMENGDIVVSINAKRVKNLMDFYLIMNDTEINAFDFLLNRFGEEITIGIVKR